MERKDTIEKLINKYEGHMRDIGENNVYIPAGTACVDSYKDARLQVLASILFDLRQHIREQA